MYMDQLTVILSVWKRNNLESQIEAVLSNTLAPDRIMVYQNEAHIDISNIVKKFNLEHFWSVNFNHRYHSSVKLAKKIEVLKFKYLEEKTEGTIIIIINGFVTPPVRYNNTPN